MLKPKRQPKTSGLNDKTKAIINRDAETKTLVTLECQSCSERMEEEADSEKEAQGQLHESVSNSNWYIGTLDSEEYQSEFTILCNDCLRHVVEADSKAGVDGIVQKKFEEMV